MFFPPFLDCPKVRSSWRCVPHGLCDSFFCYFFFKTIFFPCLIPNLIEFHPNLYKPCVFIPSRKPTAGGPGYPKMMGLGKKAAGNSGNTRDPLKHGNRHLWYLPIRSISGVLRGEIQVEPKNPKGWFRQGMSLGLRLCRGFWEDYSL